jgi:hypothetical protein
MSNSRQIIGFASQYYTLWSVRKETIYVTDSHGNHWPSYEQTYYTFHKNISKDIEKVREIYPTLSIDEGLRGVSRSFSQKGTEDLSPEIIKFGKYYGMNISEIAEKDFKYLLWLRDNCYGYKTRDLINELPQIVEYEANLKREADERLKKTISSFLKVGEYEVSFEYNPGECLSHTGYDISFDSDCPPFVKERYDMLMKIMRGDFDTVRTEPLVEQFGYIDGQRYLIVFPQYKQVNGMYPYKMGYINGKIQKTKGKTFKTYLAPVGFAYLSDITQPIHQILCVV